MKNFKVSGSPQKMKRKSQIAFDTAEKYTDNPATISILLVFVRE
jgi:hypothetical protein